MKKSKMFKSSPDNLKLSKSVNINSNFSIEYSVIDLST